MSDTEPMMYNLTQEKDEMNRMPVFHDTCIKRHPRSMSDAFPDVRAYVLTGPRPKPLWMRVLRAVHWLMLPIIVGLLAALVIKNLF